MSESLRLTVVNPEGRLVQTVGSVAGPSGSVPSAAPSAGAATSDGAASSAPAALAPRLDSLEGKLVYLVDTGFGGSYLFMQQLQRWMAEHLPSVSTVRKRKPGGPFSDDGDALWDEIKAKGGDAVVLGVGG